MLLQVAKNRPKHTQPPTCRRMNQICWQGQRWKQVLDPEPCVCWVKPSQGESTLVCGCVCVCGRSRFLIACQPSLHPPELRFCCDTICHFIVAESRQQNLLLGSADFLHTHTHTHHLYKPTEHKLLLRLRFYKITFYNCKMSSDVGFCFCFVLISLLEGKSDCWQLSKIFIIGDDWVHCKKKKKKKS